jgi:hypothetical protein
MTVDMHMHEVELPGMPVHLDVSNDGSLVACSTSSFNDGEASVCVVRVDDGSVPFRYLSMRYRDGRGVAFLNGGRELVYLMKMVGDADRLCRVSVDSRDPEMIREYTTPDVRVSGVIRDPAARYFAVLGNQVEIWDAERNEVLRVIPAAERFRLTYEHTRATFSASGEQIYVCGTVPGMVVRYRVATGAETGRWTTPYPTSGQVVITPDDRFLVTLGPSLKGVHVHDLVRGVQITNDPDELHVFDERYFSGPWVASHDSSRLMYFIGALYTFGLPEFVDTTIRKNLIESFPHVTCAASAAAAPVSAFGSREDSMVRLFVGPDADRAANTSVGPGCPGPTTGSFRRRS